MKRILVLLLATSMLSSCSHMIRSDGGPDVSELSRMKVTTIDDVVAPYRENLLRANNENGDKWVKVSGHVEYLKKNGFPSIYLYTLVIAKYPPTVKDVGTRISCDFASNKEISLIGLNAGDEVVVTGQFAKDINSPDSIRLIDCSVEVQKKAR